MTVFEHNGRGVRALLYLLCAAVLCPAAPPSRSPQGGAWLPASIEFESIAPARKFRDSIEPDALRFACARNQIELELVFQFRRLPFDDGLLRQMDGRVCHIFYEPTLPGFRANPDNDPITELFLDVDFTGFLGWRADRFGDVLDIAKALLPQVDRPLDVSLGVPLNQDRTHYEKAIQFHFPNSIHRFRFRDNTWEQTNPWAQDYLKSGSVNGQPRILVTRLAYEGKAENGVEFKPMLDSLDEERFVRSKLSWEGGDLQFALHPKDPTKTILFYGDSARLYWGQELTGPEFEYVLKQEFGADLAFDLSDLTVHVDYFVSLLPAAKVALVAEPVEENFGLARGALDVLLGFLRPAIPPELADLDRLMVSREEAFGPNLDRIRKVLSKAEKSAAKWRMPFDLELGQRIESYVAANCAEQPKDCVSPEGVRRMLAQNPKILRDWASGATSLRTREAAAARLLNVIGSQLPGARQTGAPNLEGKVRRLEELGFRVIRVPQIGGFTSRSDTWAGISFTNSALIDRTLFVPEFGFGPAEKELQEQLRKQLPEGYRLIPVYARHMLLHNGGIHCVIAFGRVPANRTAAQ